MNSFLINNGTINGNVNQGCFQSCPSGYVTNAASVSAAPGSAAFDYDVAISYSGRQTPFVSRVSRLLKQEGFRVFFAPDCEEEFLAQDMILVFHEIYRRRCLYVAAFISEDYLKSDICMSEISSALLRSKDENRNCLIPVSMADKPLKDLLEGHPIHALNSDIHHIDVHSANVVLTVLETVPENHFSFLCQEQEKHLQISS